MRRTPAQRATGARPGWFQLARRLPVLYCNVRFLEATAFAVFLELFQARYPPKVLDLVCDTKSHYNVALIAFHALEHFDHISKNPAWRAKNQDARSSPSLWVKSASFAQTPFAVIRMLSFNFYAETARSSCFSHYSHFDVEPTSFDGHSHTIRFHSLSPSTQSLI